MKKLMVRLFMTLLLVTTIGVTETSYSQAAKTKEQLAKEQYVIKVNKQQNVVTIYKKQGKKYVPHKAFLCSTGYATPVGTFPLLAKYRWHQLMGPSYGQYCSRIVGGFLFHSVWYYKPAKNTQSYVQYNRLGTTASHGCVRLTVADSKWIYDNCPTGTKVVIYNSSNPGPLGKPKARKMSGYMGWDPTDPDPANPYFVKLKSFKINKTKVTLTVGNGKKKAQTVLKASGFKPKKAMIKEVRFVSSKPKIATVNQKGEIKAKKAGKCKIYVYAKGNGKLKRTCKLVVKKYKKPQKKQQKKPTPTAVPIPTMSPVPTATPTAMPTPTGTPIVTPEPTATDNNTPQV